MGPLVRNHGHDSPCDAAYRSPVPSGAPKDIRIFSDEPALWPERLITRGKTQAAESFEDLVKRVLAAANGHPIRTLRLVNAATSQRDPQVLRIGEESIGSGERPYEQHILETLRKLAPWFAGDGKVIIEGGPIQAGLGQALSDVLGVPVEVNPAGWLNKQYALAKPGGAPSPQNTVATRFERGPAAVDNIMEDLPAKVIKVGQ